MKQKIKGDMVSLELVTTVVENADDLASCEANLSTCTLLALDCEGVKLSRMGEITIVQVSSRSHCFLFDVLALDKTSAAVMFLKKILEDSRVVKIVHDVKMDSDALYHCLGIALSNVHDTQAWDLIINGREENLNKTLVRSNCTPNLERDSTVYVNNRFWAQRPLTELMVDWASGDVGCLFELYDAQIRHVRDNDHGGAAEAMCEIVSNERLTLRDKIVQTYKIREDKVGLFIGTGGKNIKRLMEQIPGTFYHVDRGGVRGFMRDVDVYAPDEVTMMKALLRLEKYTHEWY
jgi:ribonuclease D